MRRYQGLLTPQISIEHSTFSQNRIYYIHSQHSAPRVSDVRSNTSTTENICIVDIILTISVCLDREMSDLNLTIKFSNSDKFEVVGNEADTVLEFKQKIAATVSVAAPQQRLIHKGKVLKDDLQLESYGIKTGDTVYLVKGISTSAPTPSSTSTPSVNTNSSSSGSSTNPAPSMGAPPNPMANPFASMGAMPGGMGGFPDISRMQDQLSRNPEMMQQILNSPMMDNFLNNPEMMQNMMLNNPQLQSMMNANPQIRQIMTDPAVIRQAMETLRNPNAMQEALRSQDLQMSRLETLPGMSDLCSILIASLRRDVLNLSSKSLILVKHSK